MLLRQPEAIEVNYILGIKRFLPFWRRRAKVARPDLVRVRLKNP